MIRDIFARVFVLLPFLSLLFISSSTFIVSLLSICCCCCRRRRPSSSSSSPSPSSSRLLLLLHHPFLLLRLQLHFIRSYFVFEVNVSFLCFQDLLRYYTSTLRFGLCLATLVVLPMDFVYMRSITRITFPDIILYTASYFSCMDLILIWYNTRYYYNLHRPSIDFRPVFHRMMVDFVQFRESLRRFTGIN